MFLLRSTAPSCPSRWSAAIRITVNTANYCFTTLSSLPYAMPSPCARFSELFPHLDPPPPSGGIEPGPEQTIVKINQDRGSMEWPFAGSPADALFGVFDGHGKVAHQLPF